MIGTVMYCSWLNLKRDKVSLGLAFILPVVFFSIFAAIFGGMSGDDGNSARPITIALVDQDGTDFSKAFIKGLKEQPSLSVSDSSEVEGKETAYDETTAAAAVRKGKVNIALILLADLQNKTGFNTSAANPAIKLIYDPSNPMAQHTVRGLLQSVGMSANPTARVEQGLQMLQQFGGPLTDTQRAAVDMFKQMQAGGGSSNAQDPVPVEAISVHEGEEEGDSGPDLVAYYAAGIGVMFLLFSMSGAGGGLLEEEESGTMDRLMISQLGMNRLIIGKWLFFACLGASQLVLMFTWGAVAFGLSLFTTKHLIGFIVVTIPLSLAGAAFGLLLATLSKSRAQLSGMSTIIILVMSALGGSMVPRFVMPAYMDVAARFTLNGWAIDAFLKIFWREDPSHSLVQSLIYLLPELTALSLITASMLAAALWLSKRWQPV